MSHPHIEEALEIISKLGLPRAQQNERTALCLLALLNLSPEKNWVEAESPLIGITPMMEFAAEKYGKKYAPNSRETFRRFSMHQFVEAGIALYNPDNPARPVNSPKAVYQIEPTVLLLLQTYNSTQWQTSLVQYMSMQQTLAEKYARERDLQKIPIQVAEGKEIQVSPGTHSLLIKAIIEEFAPRFIPGAQLIYAGDTGEKWGYFDQALLEQLGVTIDTHGKMPDVVLYYKEKKWLILVESVTSHGPVDAKRHHELSNLFKDSQVGCVYVTAFPSRSLMAKYLTEISWETEVWVSEAPTHLIHFNGDRFLGPH